MEKKSSEGSDDVKLSKRNPALHLGLGLRQINRYENLGKGHRIPLATRQRSWVSDFTCRVGMVLEDPRNAEDFVRMPSVAMRSDSKAMTSWSEVCSCVGIMTVDAEASHA
jgi:hypothetical protein